LELFASMAGIEKIHVPYKRRAVGGRPDERRSAELFTSVSSCCRRCKAAGSRRSGIDPAAHQRAARGATIDEAGVSGYNAASWYGFVCACRRCQGQDCDIDGRSSGNARRRNPHRLPRRFRSGRGTPEDFCKIVRDEIPMGESVKAAGISRNEGMVQALACQRYGIRWKKIRLHGNWRRRSYALSQHLIEARSVSCRRTRAARSLGCALGAPNPGGAGFAPLGAAPLRAPYAHIWGPTKKSVQERQVNCTMTRDLDMHDTYFSHNPRTRATHRACLAIGQAEGPTPAQIVKAVLIAFEVQMRACESRARRFSDDRWTIRCSPPWQHGGGGRAAQPRREPTHPRLSIAGCYPVLGELRVGQISMMKSVSAGCGHARHRAAYMAKEA